MSITSMSTMKGTATATTSSCAYTQSQEAGKSPPLLFPKAVEVRSTTIPNEISGMVRDIRAIPPSDKPWRRAGLMLQASCCSRFALALILVSASAFEKISDDETEALLGELRDRASIRRGRARAVRMDPGAPLKLVREGLLRGTNSRPTRKG
jgi:hypothetical protein